MTQRPLYHELSDRALISFAGDDAVAFLHAQLTSDLAALKPGETQYSGYCSPKGRLLATFLVWRLEDEVLLELPAALREPIQTRLARYVLRAKVKVTDAGERYRLFGVSGPNANAALIAAFGAAPGIAHRSIETGGVRIAALPIERYVLLVSEDAADAVRERLASAFPQAGAAWPALDVEAGVPVVTAPAQEEYVPQMVNLDLVGGVSFNKGCYPGQEIVARMHYLGRLKQRMYRVRVPGLTRVAPGQTLFSAEFGAEQSCGAILYAGACGDGGCEALAVIQKASAEAGDVRFGALAGPRVEILPLPYTLPE
ncbi:MAG TPA: folate-binding protein [Burkholderiales bacterium]|nr:folate-binding protein [Burkholderiales bacterium]